MNKIEPGLGINRRYLHDEVADRMRELIQSGEMEPRARVNESELTERFGISRTPLREAIKILATEGLLELLPNRGARVASISQIEIDEMLEVIAGLEATAAEVACRKITDAEVEAIRADHLRMVEAWKETDEATYFSLNRRIHESIMAASRNATLMSIYTSLSGRIQRSRYTAHQTGEQWEKAVGEHERMVELLQARDGAALSPLMREHIWGKKAVIAENFGESDA
ncbi:MULTISPECIES: GntR family transcriptional regulator [Methylobacterium]|uniref:Fatty acid metabolism regulator protein n=2 Tax=Pseudomonadota TaxID=1224 RepID=A0ABQ4T4F7_9HYPH|nr:MULTISPECIES: GntR family transcriptional regulator [Methylobacterium]PIU06102.1 MAG: GntR family transcriptional regulator [Methylobacterium sp. CG09_land_8_20_14_0_10_71_15]PIU12579.1 MAG: GntR family transcriptional regulator [Methylobacterium sp. CG08_land_8_20_14_0_20_71_15]GBU19490.1 transcriptional regulator [Methylobacterium sp.]GJE08796.1 Fatty acid metabolism regulator protein [Methylobacterium jeotgali]